MSKLPQTWDLESIFPGGSESAAFEQHLTGLKSNVQQWGQLVDRSTDEADDWAGLIEAGSKVFQALGQAGGFVGCLTSQNTKDEPAKLLLGRLMALHAELMGVMNRLDAKALQVSDERWTQLMADPRLAPVAFPLTEIREKASRKMNATMETLVTDLAVDGYHAWSQLYDTIVGRMTIPFDGQDLSVGQAANKFSEPDREMRARLFTTWEQAWDGQAELCASALNAIGGYRLALYKHRGWDSILQEPAELNRMTEGTLNAMWDAISRGKGRLTEYLNRKAQLLGADKLAWYDLMAPVGKADRKVGYDEAAAFIIENFRRFSPHMAEFADTAFRKGWIEAEDRPGKAPGGWCTGLPQSEESRIFMTYGGDSGSVRTLAHELGHAYHSYVMRDLPPLTQEYAMNVAETASTFAEFLITSAAIQAAKSDEEKLALLDAKLIEATAYLMNIHARFIFEVEFYETRRKGPVGMAQLNDMMVRAQKEAYQESLGVYHPTFWAAKGHFYGTGMPFYNFPYTFGFLFSSGLYARATTEGPGFSDRYVALLRDTGRMTVEELAQRHLSVDLTKPDFWATGVAAAMADVDEFLRVTK